MMEFGVPESSPQVKDEKSHVLLTGFPPQVLVEMVAQVCRNTRQMSGIIKEMLRKSNQNIHPIPNVEWL